jgi:hypothetical protein
MHVRVNERESAILNERKPRGIPATWRGIFAWLAPKAASRLPRPPTRRNIAPVRTAEYTQVRRFICGKILIYSFSTDCISD